MLNSSSCRIYNYSIRQKLSATKNILRKSLTLQALHKYFSLLLLVACDYYIWNYDNIKPYFRTDLWAQ